MVVVAMALVPIDRIYVWWMKYRDGKENYDR
jgi:hypothetical protein